MPELTWIGKDKVITPTIKIPKIFEKFLQI